MNAATAARIAAWNVIANLELPVGTKVTVEDEAVLIHPRGGQPVGVPYGPEDAPSSVYEALKKAAQAPAKDND